MTTKNEPSPPSDARRMLRSLALYLVPTILVRGVSLFMTPVYTRVLPPAEYAIVGVANTVSAGLAAVLCLGLQGALLRLYADCKSESERRGLVGSILVALVAIPTIATLALEIAGRAGALDIIELLPFRPYGELVLFGSFASLFSAPLTTLYMAQERPLAFGVFSTISSLTQIALTIVFVVALERGPAGALEANLVGQGASSLVALSLLSRYAQFRPELPRLRESLLFGLPLVPHYVTNWALSLSDRLVLERYVPAADIGRYSLAYLFNMALAMVSGAMSQTLHPMVMRRLTANPADPLVPRLGTYAIGSVMLVGLGLLAVARDALSLLAPESYADALRYIPWVILGAVFQGVYFVWSLGTWYSRRTRWMPMIAVAVAVWTIGLNLAFVPRFGADAAAAVTAVSYATLAVAHGALAQSLHPIPWEYKRWFKLGGAAVPVIAAIWLSGALAPAPRTAVNLTAVILGWPVILWLIRFLHADERIALRAHTAAILARLPLQGRSR